MDLILHNVNSFVLGDLVLDHAVFVDTKTTTFQKIDREDAYHVKRRTNTAGGAANCARALAAISSGEINLWGIVGRSLWGGSFADILEDNHTYDNSYSKVTFSGVVNPAARMNTITRLILEDDDIQRHLVRYDDSTKVLPSLEQVRAIIDHIKDSHSRSRLGVIIINDLDLGSLTTSLVASILEFANRENIPTFVDPKLDSSKYKGLPITSMLPNLKEWCNLVGDPNNENEWRNRIRSRDGLMEIGRRSLRHLRNVRYHVITCDKDGAVLVIPSKTDPNGRDVIHIEPSGDGKIHGTRNELGCGDIVTAVVAHDYAALIGAGKKNPESKCFFDAFIRANAAVGLYRALPWCRMVNRQEIINIELASRDVTETCPIVSSPAYLPEKSVFRLSDAETLVPGIYSEDKAFIDIIERIEESLGAHWDSPKNRIRHMFVTGEGGSGKTQVCLNALRNLDSKGIRFETLPKEFCYMKTSGGCLTWLDEQSKKFTDREWIVYMADEAFKKDKIFNDTGFVEVLDKADKINRRFLLINAKLPDTDISESELLSRFQIFEIPNLRSRPNDIPVIFASKCLDQMNRQHIKCEGDVLLALIERILSDGIKRFKSVRDLLRISEKIADAADERTKDERTPTICVGDLAAVDFKSGCVACGTRKDVFEFRLD